ncbi:hypothetical protein LTR49_028381, partial [Elasticomyces elasticus]
MSQLEEPPNLSDQLPTVHGSLHEKAPCSLMKPVDKARFGIISTFNRSSATQGGDKLPAFDLSDANGEKAFIDPGR